MAGEGPIPRQRACLEVYPDAPRAYLTRAGVTDNDYLSEGEVGGVTTAAAMMLLRSGSSVRWHRWTRRTMTRTPGWRAASRGGVPRRWRGTVRGAGARRRWGQGGQRGEETDDGFVWNPRPLSPNPTSDVGTVSKISPARCGRSSSKVSTPDAFHN